VSEPGFQVPTRITTVTRQTGEYKVDLTCHPKFPFAFEEITIAFEVDGSIIKKNNGPLGRE
jgi:hypothetical protein